MSIEHRAKLVVGVKEDDLENFDIPAEYHDELVDNWLVDTDSWCGGTHIFGDVWAWCDDGDYQDITRIMSKSEFQAECKYVHKNLAECGIDVPLEKIRAYLICEVF